MKNQILLALLLLGCINVYGQTGKEYLENINANYDGLNSFELVLDYELYKGHHGTELKDEYQSTLSMNGKKSHRKIYNDEIITAQETSLVLNHELKTIQILPGVQNEIFDQDITASLEHCQDVKVVQTPEGKRLTLTFKKYSSIEYARIDIVVDDQFWVRHMTLYYATRINYSRDYFNPDYDYPRLEVSYAELRKNTKDKEGRMELSNYVRKEGDVYRPTSLYQNYEVIQ